MIKQFADSIRPVLEFPFVRRTRRNHALEHATIHMLSRKHRRLRVAGRASDGGFVLIGEVPTDQVEAAVDEALKRMKRGERGLAVHPNCGTNLVTTGFMTTAAAALGLSGGSSRRHLVDRFGIAMALVMAAGLAAQPLGQDLQKHFTTEGDPGDRPGEAGGGTRQGPGRELEKPEPHPDRRAAGLPG